MIYAYDEPVVFPTIDLYDSGMMGAYLTAAKDLYDKALEDEKDFLEKYGDFLSPITADVNYWYNSVLGPMYDKIDLLYELGGDPLRNPADRAIARQWRNAIIRSGQLPKLKLSALAALKYIDARAKLEAAGKYNPAFEKMILNNMGYPDFDSWDTTKNGVWNRMSPAEFLDLNKYTSHIFDDLQASTIGMTKDGRYRIKGVSEKAMRASLTPHLGGIVGSDLGKWYYNQAKTELQAEGNADPSDTEIMSRLLDNIITANKERMYQLEEVDPYTMLAIKARDEMNKARYNADRADNRVRLKASLSGGGGSGNRLGGGSNRGGSGRFNFNEVTYKQGLSTIFKDTNTGIKLAKYAPGGTTGITDFNADAWGLYIGDAQKERAQSIYGNKNNSRNKVGFDSHFGEYGLRTDLMNFDNKHQTPRLLDNENVLFLYEQSNAMAPESFASWVTGKKTTNSKVLMSNSQIDRLYSQNEVALGAYGVESTDKIFNYSTLFNNGSKESKKIRDVAKSNNGITFTTSEVSSERYDTDGKKTGHSTKNVLKTRNVYMQSTGRYTTVVGKDNRVRVYQYVDIYTSDDGKTFKKENKTPVLYDMHLTSNKSYDANLLNLYWDPQNTMENIFTDYGGNQSVMNTSYKGKVNTYGLPDYDATGDYYIDEDEDEDDYED